MDRSSSQNIFFDVSGIIAHLSHATTYTGIQRVVASVLAELTEVPDLYISWARRGTSGYSCAKLSSFERDDFLDPLRLKAALSLSGGKTGVFPPLQRYAKDKKKYRFHLTKLWIANLLKNERPFVKKGTSLQQWQDWHRRVQPQQKFHIESFSSVARKDDHLIVLDAVWTLPSLSKHFIAVRDLGLKITSVVYDLIPLVTPNYAVPQLPRPFYEALVESTKYSSNYAAISDYTADDLRKFLTAHNVSIPVTTVPLAQEKLSFPQKTRSKEKEHWLKTDAYPLMKDLDGVLSEARGIIGSPYVLSVGTVEIRKNGWRLLQAWDLLTKTLPRGQVPRLVIAGRSGWMNQDFERFLEASGHLNGFVTRLEAPSDEELDLLYRHCLFTVMPALYEGWGLPVGESLSYGRTAVVANNSSLPEVGGDMVHYCDATSITSIMEACKDLITDPELRAGYEARIAAADLRQWRDVAEDLLNIARC